MFRTVPAATCWPSDIDVRVDVKLVIVPVSVSEASSQGALRDEAARPRGTALLVLEPKSMRTRRKFGWRGIWNGFGAQ
jgi:hypothetical protein